MFPLWGDKTGVLIPLFWVDRYPLYRDCCWDLLERIKGSADEILLVTDDTVGGVPVAGVRHEVVPGPVKLRRFFEYGYTRMAELGVGAFYWVGADNIHDAKGVRETLAACMTKADVVFGDYAETQSRDDKFPVHGEHRFYFSAKAHSWPDSACFRTSIFTTFPPKDVPRTFILSSMAKALKAGTPIEWLFMPQHGWYYYQHDRTGNDRSFISYQEGI